VNRLKIFTRLWPKPIRRFLAERMASAVSRMAQTGEGTDACLRRNCLPMRVHFYSPVPDIEELRRRRVWARRSDLSGIDFRPQAQLGLLAALGAEFGQECDWPPKLNRKHGKFFTENNTFSFSCAAALHCMLRWLKPRRVFEIGSGYSSLIISAALQRNVQDGQLPAEYTIVDPYPGSTVTQGLPGLTEVRQQPVEHLDPGVFKALGENDFLFIDSGHTVKTGGDVNFLILDVLPRLAPGVVIHFHDIPLPCEYHEVYFTNPSFRVFWTEAYLLQAFLACNRDFEVLLGMWWIMTDHRSAFQAAFSHYNPTCHLLTSQSFWIRRTCGELRSPP
jgi:hypothetical protein